MAIPMAHIYNGLKDYSEEQHIWCNVITRGCLEFICKTRLEVIRHSEALFPSNSYLQMCQSIKSEKMSQFFQI